MNETITVERAMLIELRAQILDAQEIRCGALACPDSRYSVDPALRAPCSRHARGRRLLIALDALLQENKT